MERNRRGKGKVKKVFKVIGNVLLAICIVLILAGIIGTIINKRITEKKMAEYEEYYGEFYDTTQGRINYTVVGAGDQTIVLLPGLGSSTPHYEFTELASYLSEDYKVIIVEPLGYGLSDDTDEERSPENICNEIHEVLSGIGEEQYYLMCHSISGLYALKYCNLYEDEVLGFVGIDASVPAQIQDENAEVQALFTKIMKICLIDTGIYRIINANVAEMPDEFYMNPEYKGTPVHALQFLSPEEREAFIQITLGRNANDTVIAELKHIKESCESQMNDTFPKSIPVLYMLAEDTIETTPNWVRYHEDLSCNNEASKVITMEGSHYLHLCDADELAETFEIWVNNAK